jgi:CubicO group peptidase (beta-lactamase class C family)
MQALVDRLRHALDSGPLPAIQVAVARDNQLLLFETLGEADNTQRFNIFSCTKPLVASAVWRLVGEGAIAIEETVAHYIPSFGTLGKHCVTVEQLLCHTCGFPRAPMTAPDWWTREGRLDRMSRWHLDWEPGTRMSYHPLSAHWVLAELIERVTGCDYRQYIYLSIVEPLGLQRLRLGVPVAEQHDIVTLQSVGAPPAAKDIRALFGADVLLPSVVDASLLMFNDPAVRELGVPGAGAVSTAADVALFYQALLHNPGQLWHPQVLADAVGRVRVEFTDPMTRAPANRGLGVVIAGSGKFLPYRGMGTKVSPRAFGHQGVGGQVAWADPATGISFCLLTSGLDANPLRSAQLCIAASDRAAALPA